jgi:hypothetical protein
VASAPQPGFIERKSTELDARLPNQSRAFQTGCSHRMHPHGLNNQKTDREIIMTNQFFVGFAAGAICVYLIFKLAHLWTAFKARRNQGFTYSKALKRSLKTFNLFNPI